MALPVVFPIHWWGWGAREPVRTEIEWHTSALVFGDGNIVGENIDTIQKTYRSSFRHY
jgi:hypothetical protein